MGIIKLQQLKDNFDSEIKKSINQKYVIDEGIKEVLDYIKNIPSYNSFRNTSKSLSKDNGAKTFKIKIPNLLRNLFSEAFNSYIKFGKYELERFHADTNEMYQIKEDTVKQAFEFSEYYKWLNDLLTSPQKVEKKNGLSHKQKLLALHYLGLNTSKYENTKTAKILSEILELSEDNTRIFLSYLSAGKNEVRTKANLEKVNQLFEKQGLTEISDSIKTDIEKL